MGFLAVFAHRYPRNTGIPQLIITDLWGVHPACTILQSALFRVAVAATIAFAKTSSPMSGSWINSAAVNSSTTRSTRSRIGRAANAR